MLHLSSSRQMRISRAMIFTLLTKLIENIADLCLFQHLWWQLIWHLSSFCALSSSWLAFEAKTLLYGMPIYNRTIGGKKIHSLIDARMLEVRWSEELMNWLEGDFVRIIDELWWFLRYFKLKDFAFFIGLNEIITSMKLIFDDRFSVFSAKWLRIGLFSLLRIHMSDHLLPFDYRISLTIISVDQDHNAAFSTHHIP